MFDTQNVRLVSSSLENDLYERLSFSEGSQVASRLDNNEINSYVDKAYVPQDKWRPLTKSEFFSLTHLQSSDSFSNIISIEEIPNSLKTSIRQLPLDCINSKQDFGNILREHSNKVENFHSSVKEFLTSVYYEKSPQIYHGFCINEPGLLTVSTNHQNQYLGLHLDTSIEFDIKQTKFCPNRISINLGSSDRYLYFIDKTVDDLREYIHQAFQVNDLSYLSNSQIIVSTFFKLYPNYPVVRLIQKPFECYIAPTDNVIHDGSTVDFHDYDITFIMRGYLNPVFNFR